MKSLDKMNKVNDYLIGFWKIIYLNGLWLVFSLLGLGIFGVGPATYAVTKYCFRWLHFKEEPAVFQSIWKYYKEAFKQSVLVSWVLIAIFTILIVNLFNVTEWYFQVANIFMFVMAIVGGTHIYNVMVALRFKNLREITRASLMMGIGYLHYTIILWTILIGTYYVLSSIYPSLLFLFGTGFTIFLITFVGNVIVKDFEEEPQEDEEIKKIYSKES
ncbi:YesL family protein [Jeotgalibaca ciconiae]|nr:DUF624 domain-containing protein [Jeotgalibaca ciconiae]